MAAGFWGDTLQEFRPGVAFKNFANTAASTINARIPIFFSQSHIDSWLRSGETFGSASIRVKLVDFFVNQNTAPSSLADLADPNYSNYNWNSTNSPLDSYCAMPNLALLGGNPIILSFGNTSNNIPNWIKTGGYTRIRSDGQHCLDYRLADAKTIMKNFFTAMAARYATSRKWWCISMGEQINSTGAAEQLGEAEVINHHFDAFGGRVSVCIGGNSTTYATLRNACYPTIGVRFPDPKLWQLGGSKAYMIAEFENRPILESTEDNGMNAVSWPDSPTNPFGNNSSTPSHVPTAQELAWYFSEDGPVPVHVLEWDASEWSFTPASLNLASVYTANDIYMASGATAQGDTLPALPANYDTVPPASGTPDLPTLETYSSGVQTQGATGTGNTVTISPSAGELLFGLFSTSGSLNTTGSNFSNVTGLSQIISERATDATTRPECRVDYKVAVGDETGITFDALQLWLATALRVSGAHPTSPIGQVSSTNTGGTGTNTITVPGFTTSDDNSSVLIVVALRDNTPTSVACTNSDSKIFEHDPPATNRDLAAFWLDVATQGATGDFVITWTNNTRAAAVAIEIKGEPQAASDTTAPTLHASPAVTLHDATQTSQDLLWNDATDDTAVIDYILERSLDGSTNWVVHAIVTQAAKTASEGSNTYSYRATGLVADTSYYWRYRARDAVPNVSAYSTVSAALDTDDPPDTVAPAGSFVGAESAVYDSGTGETAVGWTQATDAVDAQSVLRYYVWAYLQSENVDMSTDTFTHGPFIGVDEATLTDLPDGDYDFGVRVEDTSGNRDTNTALVQETVGDQTYTVTADVLRSAGGVYSDQEVEYIWEEGALSYNTSQVREAQTWKTATTDSNGGLTITLNSNTPGYLNIRTSDGKFWRSIELTPA